MSDDRLFLHDLNNKVAIVDGRIHILLKKLNAENASGFTMTDVCERLEKISVTIREIETLTKERRSSIISRDEEDEELPKGA